MKSKDNRWPNGCFYSTRSREEFIETLHGFIGIQKQTWGALITPLVESVRISGPFCANWLTTCPHIAFVDGKGLGHSTNESIPPFYVNLFEISDGIVIVDESNKPMQRDTVNLVKGAVKHGYHKKLSIVFSKFEQLEGDNFENIEDKIEHIQNSFRQVCDEIIKTKDGYLVVEDLESIPDSNFFYLDRIHEANTSDLFIKEIKKFFAGVNAKVTIDVKKNSSGQLPIKNESPINKVGSVINTTHPIPINYKEELDDAVRSFCGEWDAKLNLSSKFAGKAEHWTRIKALSRRMYYFPDAYSYDTLAPIDDFVNKIQTVIYQYIRKMGLDHSYIAAFSRKNNELSARNIKKVPVKQWEMAYGRSGTGSTSSRGHDIQKIFKESTRVIQGEIDMALEQLIKK